MNDFFKAFYTDDMAGIPSISSLLKADIPSPPLEKKAWEMSKDEYLDANRPKIQVSPDILLKRNQQLADHHRELSEVAHNQGHSVHPHNIEAYGLGAKER
jgi:hypothetical protein